MTTLLLDTNIIIRYLLKDHPLLSPKAKNFFQQAKRGEVLLYIDEVVIAEIVWVLSSSVYQKEPTTIADQLKQLLASGWIINERKNVILQALNLFAKNNLSFVDCWLYVVSQNKNILLETFDKKLQKLRP